MKELVISFYLNSAENVNCFNLFVPHENRNVFWSFQGVAEGGLGKN